MCDYTGHRNCGCIAAVIVVVAAVAVAIRGVAVERRKQNERRRGGE